MFELWWCRYINSRNILKNIFFLYRCSYDASIIPFTLVKYLDEAKYCLCGNPCFYYYLRKFVSFDCNIATNIIKSTESTLLPFDCYFCSSKCVYYAMLCK